MGIGSRIREARKEIGLSVDAFARELKVTAKTVYRWESGETEPHESTLNRAARVLGVRAAWLRTEEGEKFNGIRVTEPRQLANGEELLAQSFIPDRLEEYGRQLQTARGMLNNHFEPGIHYEPNKNGLPRLLPAGAHKLIFAFGYVSKILSAEKQEDGDDWHWTIRGALLRADKQDEVIIESLGTASTDEITGEDRDEIPGVGQKAVILATERMRIGLIIEGTAAGEVFGR